MWSVKTGGLWWQGQLYWNVVLPPKMCDLSRQVVSYGSGLSRQVSLYMACWLDINLKFYLLLSSRDSSGEQRPWQNSQDRMKNKRQRKRKSPIHHSAGASGSSLGRPLDEYAVIESKFFPGESGVRETSAMPVSTVYSFQTFGYEFESLTVNLCALEEKTNISFSRPWYIVMVPLGKV